MKTKGQTIYTALMECNTIKEFNHITTIYIDEIMQNEWLKECFKSTIKRLNAVANVKRIYEVN